MFILNIYFFEETYLGQVMQFVTKNHPICGWTRDTWIINNRK